jgi:hypothetical protein
MVRMYPKAAIRSPKITLNVREYNEKNTGWIYFRMGTRFRRPLNELVLIRAAILRPERMGGDHGRVGIPKGKGAGQVSDMVFFLELPVLHRYQKNNSLITQ